MKCSDIERYLKQLAPETLAQKGDNAGMVLGRSDKNVSRIMVAARIDEKTVGMAVSAQADMIISYEPIIADPIMTVNSQDYMGRIILKLLRNDISCYVMHTAFDGAEEGMAAQAAKKLELQRLAVVADETEYTGYDSFRKKAGHGRYGHLKKAMSVGELCRYTGNALGENVIRLFCPDMPENTELTEIAVLPAAEDAWIEAAIEMGAEVIVTGDIEYASAVKAKDRGIVVLDVRQDVIAQLFTDAVEQYLTEVVSADVEVIAAPFGEDCCNVILEAER